MSILGKPWLPTVLSLLALFLFALQPAAYQAWQERGNSLLLPFLIVAILAISFTFAQLLRDRAWLAALLAGAATIAVVFGEAYASTALNVMLVGPMAWWGEDVVGTLFIYGLPSVLSALVLTFALARFFVRKPA
jgi:uncharacterized membrane protein (DUF485 family)